MHTTEALSVNFQSGIPIASQPRKFLSARQWPVSECAIPVTREHGRLATNLKLNGEAVFQPTRHWARHGSLGRQAASPKSRAVVRRSTSHLYHICWK